MQNIGQTYKDYKKEIPNYNAWKKQREIHNAKKEYLFKTKPPSEEELKKAKAKAEVLFNAIDVMDDYSQEKAQYTEQVIQGFEQSILTVVSYISMFIMGLVGYSKFGQNVTKKIIETFTKKTIKPEDLDKHSISYASIWGMVGLYLGYIIGQIPFSAFSAKCEVAASRTARFEAMQNELDDYNQFTILNDKQKEEVENLAKNIQLSKKEKQSKKLQNSFQMINPFEAYKTVVNLLEEKDGINNTRKKYFQTVDKDIEENYKKELTKEQILEAKKDKELLTSMIEQIDIKSQDYSENTELLTRGINIVANGLSALGMFSLSDITKNMKNKALKLIISYVLPLLSSIVITSYFTNLEKLSSQVARFKAIEEMKKNPANFVYYSDEEINSVDESKIEVKKEEKDSILKFIPKIIKEYKEYKKYVKENEEKDKKYNKALKQIKINKEQEKEAAKLQRNTFYAFNRIDDNSQRYSENIEAFWEIISNPITLISGAIGAAIGTKYAKKHISKTITSDEIDTKAIAAILGSVTLSLIPPFVLEMFSTKQQKEASRVANYKAIEDLKDYQNFA